MPLFKILVFGFLIFTCNGSYAQKSKQPKISKDKVDSISNSLEKINLLEKNKEKEQIFFSLIKLIGESENEITDSLKAEIYHEFGHFYYNNYKDVDALKVYKKALEFREKSLNKNHPKLAGSYFMTAVVQAFIGELSFSIKNYEKAARIYKILDQESDLIDCQINQASLLVQLGEYEKALFYFQSSLSLLQNGNYPNKERIANIFEKLGIVYYKINQPQLAITNLKEAINLYQVNPEENIRNLGICYGHLGEISIHNKAYRLALKHYQKAIQFMRKVHGENHLDVALYYESEAIAYKELKQFQKANEQLSTSYSINKNLLKNKKGTAFRRNYHNFGALNLDQHHYEQAINYFQKALQQSIYNFNHKDIYQNPNWDTAEFLGAKIDILQDLDFKASSFYLWYKSSNDPKYLNIAYQTYQKAIELTDLMRAEFSAKGSKQFWLKESFPIFEKAIRIAFELFDQTGDKVYEEQVFQFMEKNKSVLLLESINTTENDLFANMPDSLLFHQKQLVSSISQQQRTIIDLKQKKEQNDSILQIAENQLSTLKLEKFELEDVIKNQFPNYFQTVNKSILKNLGDLQNVLPSNRALIEYFYGDSTIYMLTTTKNNLQIYQTPRANISNQVQTFRATLNHPSAASKSLNQFQQQGHDLYQLLLKKSLENLPEAINELLIIRDGDLFALPFEILVSDTQKQANSWTDISYLQNDYTISYALSATLLMNKQQKDQPKPEQEFVGFAPLFQGDRSPLASRSCDIDSLSQLDFNEIEVDNIAQLMDGQFYGGILANKADFLQESKNAQILHLATHACIDDQNPAQSRIYFTDDYFYLHELYNLEVNADMVVLSACETGIGEYQHGEGMMSLAHGFTYAGAPSITTSLWSVNDQSTAELMQYYYQHLKNGQPKHQALRQAKLDFLQNQESAARLHPYYWAGFVHVGDYQALDIGAINSYYWLLGIGFFSLFSFIFWKKPNFLFLFK